MILMLVVWKGAMLVPLGVEEMLRLKCTHRVAKV